MTLLVVGSRPSSAAAPPPTLPPEVTTSNAPSPADVDLIVAYCKDGVSRLGSGDFREVEKARDFLLAPLNLPGVTGAFRHAYTKALFSRPIDILRYIDGPQPHPRINAFRVIENLGTGDALDAMVERADSSRRPSLDVGGRLWAARAAGTILRSTRNSDVIVPSKISKAVRALGSAAEREPDVNVLRRQFDALGAVNTTEARNELVGA
ncbi:MAG: hypothetical protein KDA25_04000, partial [Phycisphaerales bacterium]|nr:hypothetical protein [Phycisphaerales bacterium]